MEDSQSQEAKEVLRESSEEKNVAKDRKQDTGETDRQQQTETEKEEVYSDLNKTPGLRKEVCRKGEEAVKEEGESKRVGEEIHRTQAEREVTEQSATDAPAAQAPIPNETACSTGENKEEEQEHQEEEEEKRAHLGGAAAEGSEKVEFKKVKKTRRGKRGKKKKRVQTENETDWSDYDEEEEEGSGWGTYSLHRRRAEERWCDRVASPPEADLRQRFYRSRQICYGHYYYNRVERRREGKEEEERRGRPQRGSFISLFRDRRLEKSSREEEEEGRGRAWPDHCRRPLYPRQRWMNDYQEAMYAPGREYMERERRLETGAWLETGTELWNRHWEEVEDTGVGMRLSFWCPRGRESGDRWSYQRVRRQLVKHSAQR